MCINSPEMCISYSVWLAKHLRIRWALTRTCIPIAVRTRFFLQVGMVQLFRRMVLCLW